MRLSAINEGIVSASRGRIVNVKNDLATVLADSIKDMGFREPDVEFADSTGEDAILYVDISGRTIMVKIISDDDIQIQVPEEMSSRLKIHDYQKLGSPRQVLQALRRIQMALRERLVDRL